jgi:peptide/nickel transport system permease protein
MLTYISRRIIYSIPVFVVASFIVYWGVSTTFNPLVKYTAAARTNPAIMAQKRHQFGLDQGLVAQWWHWFTGLLHGDLGNSYASNDSVVATLRHALWPTIQLMFWGTAVALVLAIAIGVYSAVKQYSAGDYALTGASYIGIAMPPYISGLLLIALFVTLPYEKAHLSQPILYNLGLHGTGQSGLNPDYLRHIALPVIVLALQSIAVWSRFQRASMLDVLNADYVRTARAKGVPQRKVIFKHAFRNALIPLVTVVALDTAFLIGGLVITEQIFSIPGMGILFIRSISSGDAPVLMGWFMIVAIFVIVFNLFADLMYGVLDPRIRLT